MKQHPHQKPLTKATALLLAFLMLFGAAPLAGLTALAEGLTPQATPVNNSTEKELLILTAPDVTEFIVGLEEPSLIGLEVSLDDVEYHYNTDNNVEFWLEYDRLEVGTNEYTLHVYYYDRVEGQIRGTATLEYTGLSALDVITATPIVLKKDEPKTVQLSQTDGDYTLLTFTPEKDGSYLFRSNWPLVEGDGDVEPYAILLDAAGNLLYNSYYDFWIIAELLKDHTYYLVVDYSYWTATAPKVTVEITVESAGSDILELGEAATVRDYGTLFFTPEESGWYSFKSFGNAYADPAMDLFKVVYDDEWYEYYGLFHIAGNDDAAIALYSGDALDYWQIGQISKGTVDFSVTAYLDAGETYYISTYDLNWFENGAYQMAVTKTQDYTGKLDLRDVNLNVRANASYTAPFKTAPDDCDVLFMQTAGDAAHAGYYEYLAFYRLNPFRAGGEGFTGMKRGTTTATYNNLAGDAVGSAKINVSYSLTQWLLVIFLLGWAWVPLNGTYNYLQF
ncbi:MAG: hypothetical protein LBS96_09365 [Oscillospiraceae bacterium]|jgi:hypothetical protein|nr:hypothetical protein [Oscillospiraceae bacterium]